VYGVVSAMVAQRTQEIGLRMALGARASQVARMIVGESLIPSVVGLAAGLIAAVAMARSMAGLVFGISPSTLSPSHSRRSRWWSRSLSPA
jgi:ABC-type antimicrobial peptide transport system permease subunit